MAIEKDVNEAFGGTLLVLGSILTSKKVSGPQKGARVYGKSIKIGDFTDGLITQGYAYKRLAKTMYYFVGSGPGAGGGRLSAGMAQCARQWVQSVMRGWVMIKGSKIELEPGERKNRYAGPPIKMSRADGYQQWIDNEPHFKIKHTVSYLTGRGASAIIATKSGKGGYTIKIDSRVYVKSWVPYSEPLRLRKKKIKAEAYLTMQEFGAGYYPARPWISGAMLGFVQMLDPIWAKALEDSLYDSYWGQAIVQETDWHMPDSGRSGSPRYGEADHKQGKLLRDAVVMKKQSEKLQSFSSKLITAVTTAGPTKLTAKGRRKLKASIKKEAPILLDLEIEAMLDAIVRGDASVVKLLFNMSR